MATRARIGIRNEDGTIRSIYSHWDGYIDGVGATLKEHYTSAEKINQLIDLGDISSLDKFCDKPEGHTFDNPKDGYTVAYGRDRGETQVAFRVHPNEANFHQYAEEYNYLFENGKWVVSKWDNKNFEEF
jgi:hypothetical protein